MRFLSLCMLLGLGVAHAEAPPLQHANTFVFGAIHHVDSDKMKFLRNQIQILLVTSSLTGTHLYYSPYHAGKAHGPAQFDISDAQREAVYAMVAKYKLRPCKPGEFSPDNAERHIVAHMYVPQADGETVHQRFILSKKPKGEANRSPGCGDLKGFETELLGMFPRIKAHYRHEGPMEELGHQRW